VNNDVTQLRRRVAELERENEILRAKVTFFERAPWMRDGIRGEQVVAELFGGTTTPVNERFDVRTRSNRVHLEVKYSNLNIAVAGQPTKRWTWPRVLGFDGRKIYDSLILVGDADVRYQHFYRDPTSPFVFFDVPFSELSAVARGTQQIVQVTTNPRKARTDVARGLFGRYQTTPDELISKYRNA
jgi:hypothetical protein